MEKILPLLPHLNATLNTIAALLMLRAWVAIRSGDRKTHKKFMLFTLGASSLFMGSYLTYHQHVGNIPFAGEGLIRPIYFGILISHVILAVAILFLVIITLTLALLDKFDKHRAIARWTLPIWLYVSVTGVVVYLMAFHLFTGH